jgi:hypothetical protein
MDFNKLLSTAQKNRDSYQEKKLGGFARVKPGAIQIEPCLAGRQALRGSTLYEFKSKNQK